ncbi:MAG: GNAT family N-acetyltransferase [Gammaproteobacteria bacterium]
MSAATLVAGKNLLVSLKATAGAPGAKSVLCVDYPAKAFLRPVATDPAWLNTNDIRLLSDWRNQYVSSFLTEFTATPARTGRWLSETVGPADDKILFMLDLPDGSTVGHIGIGFIDWQGGYCEADAIVRGGVAPKGLMAESLLQVLSWAIHSLGLARVGVRVRSDNPALGFYQKVGFVEVKRVGLRISRDADMIRWIEDASLANQEVSLVHMILNHDALTRLD